jgi:transcriptional regulator with XRE-family HTH domain
LGKFVFIDTLSNTPTPSNSPGNDSIELGIGARLKRAREDRDFTQLAVATRTKMADPDAKGISRTSLIGYEQGTSSPGLREIKLLCEVLRITPNWLVYGTDEAGLIKQASMEAFSLGVNHELRGVLRAALVLLALKGHERDSILSLALSLAGRQLGDLRLSGLMMTADLMVNDFLKLVREHAPDATDTTPLADIADVISMGLGGNLGNRIKFDVEDPSVVVGGEWLYQDPKQEKS